MCLLNNSDTQTQSVSKGIDGWKCHYYLRDTRLVKEINDCIEGQKMLTSALPANKPANGTISGEVSREEIEDWLNDIPLFE